MLCKILVLPDERSKMGPPSVWFIISHQDESKEVKIFVTDHTCPLQQPSHGGVQQTKSTDSKSPSRSPNDRSVYFDALTGIDPEAAAAAAAGSKNSSSCNNSAAVIRMQQQLSGSENATTPGGLGRRSTPGHQERSLGSFCESKNKEIVEKKQQAGSQQGAAGVNTITHFSIKPLPATWGPQFHAHFRCLNG